MYRRMSFSDDAEENITDENKFFNKSTNLYSIDDERPSESGNTSSSENVKYTSTLRNSRKKLHVYKQIIRILIKAKFPDYPKTVLQKAAVLSVTKELRKNRASRFKKDKSKTKGSNDRVKKKTKHVGGMEKEGSSFVVEDLVSSVESRIHQKKENSKRRKRREYAGRSPHASTSLEETEIAEKCDTNADYDNDTDETWTPKTCLDPYAFDEFDEVIKSLKEHRGTSIKEISKVSEYIGSSRKGNLNCRERSNLDSRESYGSKTVGKKIEGVGKSKENAKYNDRNKSNVSEPCSSKQKLNKYNCLCSTKPGYSTDIKTSSYAIPKSIEYPSVNIRKGLTGCRSTIQKPEVAIKIAENTNSVDTKLTKKFYNPLKLLQGYGESSKSKLEGQEEKSKCIDVSVQTATPIISQKKKKKAPKPRTKFSLQNFTLSGSSSKNDDGADGFNKNTAKPKAKIAMFSKYSIPVSIEINMDLRERLLNRNLVQSLITRYFTPIKMKRSQDLILSNIRTNDHNLADENGNKVQRACSNAVKNSSRCLPVIESDVLLKKSDKIVMMKKRYQLREPELGQSRCEYLYGLTSDGSTRARTPPTEKQTSGSKENYFNRKKSQPASDKESHCQIIEDSDYTGNNSLVPPSYSIFSNEGNQKNYILDSDIGITLDTQQREELLAPWEMLDIFEKVNRWHEDDGFV